MRGAGAPGAAGAAEEGAAASERPANAVYAFNAANCRTRADSCMYGAAAASKASAFTAYGNAQADTAPVARHRMRTHRARRIQYGMAGSMGTVPGPTRSPREEILLYSYGREAILC